MTEAKKQRLLSPVLLAFMGTMILANISAQMVFPLESLYVQELGATVEQVGLFFTAAAIAPLVFQILGGWLSDAVGRLQAIAIGSVAGAVSYLFYIFAPSWLWLLPSSVLSAMAIAFVSPSFQAFVAEQSTKETRGRVYGITSTMFMVVNIIGPVLGGAIAQGLSFRTMYIVAGSLYATAAGIRVLMARHANRTRKEGDRAPEKPSFAGFRRSLVAVLGMVVAGGLVTWIFISDGVRDISFNLIWRLMPLYLENEIGLSLFQIGSLQSIVGIVAMILMTPAGVLSDKKGERVGIVGGFGLIAMGWVVFITGADFWQFAISRVFVGAGWALIDPAYNSLISKAVPEKIRGTAFGLFSTSLGILSLPAPWIGAQLWEKVSPVFPFYIPLITMVAMLPVMWVKFKLPPDAGDEPDSVASVSADAGSAAS
jgi:MFS family permease